MRLLLAAWAAVQEATTSDRRKLLKWWKLLRKRRHGRRRQGPRERLVPIPIQTRPDRQFHEFLRFNKARFAQLMVVYDIPAVFKTRSRDSWAGDDALAVLLARLASVCEWKWLAVFFGRSVGAIRRVFYEVLEHVYARCRERIQCPSRSFLTDARLLAYCTALRNKGCPYRNVFGFIDGTVYQVSRPSGEPEWQRSIYNGHKCYHGLKWQGVSTPDGLVQFLQGPFSGREHDTTILEMSGLVDCLLAHFRVPAHQAWDAAESHFCLFGDPGTHCNLFLQLE